MTKQHADPAVTEATHACILAIGLDQLRERARWDGFAVAILEDYLRLKRERNAAYRAYNGGDELTDTGLSYAEVDAALRSGDGH